jgi:hypothetical protein
MKEYVHEYIKNNQGAILRGDSAAQARQDATPGPSWRQMVASLYGWYKKYIPEPDESGTRNSSPIILMGLGNIADAMNDFNEKQWEKAAKAELGVEFPIYEDWWPDTKKFWAEENYKLISKLCDDYINQINIAAEKAVTSGWSISQLAQQISKIDHSILAGRANLIARDQIGKLNGQVTQARMKAAGLEMYIWSTSGDERVRSSHAIMDEGLCRWDNASVYSDDGGKTWKPRPAGAVQVHPGEDIQCRCTALSYWDELVGEVDQKIAEIEGLDQTVNEIAAADKEKATTKSKAKIKSPAVRGQERHKANIQATIKTAKKDYPNETWLAANTVKPQYVKFPKNLEGISIAKSKFPMNKDDERTILKEVKQAKILSEKGAFIYLIPKQKDHTGRNIPGPDAIVNGRYVEFKTVTGSIKKVEERFRESRKQEESVYIRITSQEITKQDVIRKLIGIINDKDYTGGYKGNVVFTIGHGVSEKTYNILIKDLKR